MRPSHWHKRGGNLPGRLGLVFVLSGVAGCFSPPRRASEVSVDPPPQAVSINEGPARVDDSVLTVGYWKQDGPLQARVVLGKGRRVVVTEFDVELVDLQFQPPLPRQPIFKPMPIPLGPVSIAMIPGIALEVIGVGRRNTQMPAKEQQALASDLHAAFLQDLRRRGLELVSSDDLLASPAYTELRKKAAVSSSPFLVFNPLGSDTGQVLHTRTVAAPGLGVLQAGSRARESAQARILYETHADVALAVKLRVGTFQRRPALEHRSAIRLTTLDGSTTLRARHSLISDIEAAEKTAFRPIVGAPSRSIPKCSPAS